MICFFIIKWFLVCCSCRKLTRRQRSLLLTYAEEETDVQGTVTGVSPSAGESYTHSSTLLHCSMQTDT